MDKLSKFDEQPRSEIYVPSFWISKNPITNNQYLPFIKGTGNEPPNNWNSIIFPIGRGNHPVSGVSWHDAINYCRWLYLKTGRKFRLPTEAEWEKSARGIDSRIYPWGNRWYKNKANCLEYGINNTTDVGHFSPKGDSPIGVTDIAGNVWEWCSSIYQPFPYNNEDGREELDTRNPRVVRGGSFASSKDEIRCSFRNRYEENFRHGYTGFRVVITAEQFVQI